MAHQAGEEIDPGVFEAGLRAGGDEVVLDVRDREAFAAWHVDAAGRPLVNVPEDELTRHPERVLDAVPAGARVDVICNAGNASRRVATLLEALGVPARSVSGGMIGWSRLLQHDDVPLPGPVGVVQFRREARGCFSYLLAAGDKALAVDPAPDVEPYLREAARRSLRIVGVLDTHVHADHLSGARALSDRAEAPLHVSRAAIARGFRGGGHRLSPVGDGDRLRLGDAAVTVLALPGHTTDMVGLRIGDDALVGGDSLFADSVARPDLEAGDEGADGAARTLHRTLRERIGPLPDAMRLLPCHYAGGRLAGALAPPLREVRAAVAELGLDEDAFVERVLGSMPARPANHAAIIAVNLGQEPLDEAAARLEVGANNCAARPDWAQAG